MPLGKRRTAAHPTRCDYCHKPTNFPYVVTLGGIQYNFCGGPHAVAAEANFKEKVERGITPSSFEPIVEETQDVE